MYNKYYIYIREELVSRAYTITGCEAAFNAYQAAEAFVDAVGIDATVDMVDAYTGEVLATTCGDE